MLDRTAIAARIPHRGSMCLLDRVNEWSASHVLCTADSHRTPDNPLRAHGRLGAACGIEYAAQAMAVHAALAAKRQDAPRMGFLASLRGVNLHVDRLDDIAGDLVIRADLFSGDGNTVLYDFSVRAGGMLLLDGRAAVVVSADAAPAA